MIVDCHGVEYLPRQEVLWYSTRYSKMMRGEVVKVCQQIGFNYVTVRVKDKYWSGLTCGDGYYHRVKAVLTCPERHMIITK